MLTTTNYTAILNEAILMLKSTKRIRYDAEIARDLDYSKGVVSNYKDGNIPVVVEGFHSVKIIKNPNSRCREDGLIQLVFISCFPAP